MQQCLNLNDITLIALGSTLIPETKKAIKYCLQQASFKEVLFFTDILNHTDPPDDIKYVEIDRINNWHEYQAFKVKVMPRLLLPVLQTSHILIIDWDGFVVNSSAWDNEFLNYDYIGAPFPFGKICGNGGFSLRSRKFLETQNILCSDFTMHNLPEDITLSFVFRSKFVTNDCKYAPLDVAYKFSTESGGYENYNSFGFHSFKFNPQFKKVLAH
jgi:hypothetical protein